MRRSVPPPVSVMIASYNYGRYIGKAIESALAQNVDDLEVVVVDNASTDNSWDVIQDAARRDSRVRAFRNDTNIGPVANHYRGMELTRHPKTLLLSADDYLLPGHIARLLAAHLEHPEIDYFHTSLVYVDDENRLIRFSQHVGHPRGSYFGDRNYFADLLAYDCFATTTTTLFNRDHLLAREDDTAISAGDYEYFLKLALEGARFGFINVAGVAFRLHDKQWTGQANYVATGVQLLDQIRLLEKYLTPENAALYAGREQDIANLLVSKINNLRQQPAAATRILEEAQPRIDAVVQRLNTSRSTYLATPIGTDPLISVVLVESDDLEATVSAIDGLASQNYANWELVLVTNGNVDANPFLRDRAARFKTRTLYHGARQPRSACLNDALMLAQGEIITYLDPKASWPAEHLMRVASAFSANNIEAHISPVDASLCRSELSGKLVEVSRVPAFGGSGVASATMHVGEGVPLSAFAHRRGVLDRFGRFDEKLSHLSDFELVSRVCAHVNVALDATSPVLVRVAEQDKHALVADPRGYLRELQAVYESRSVDADTSARRRSHLARIKAEIEAVVSGSSQMEAFRFATIARGLCDVEPAFSDSTPT